MELAPSQVEAAAGRKGKTLDSIWEWANEVSFAPNLVFPGTSNGI